MTKFRYISILINSVLFINGRIKFRCEKLMQRFYIHLTRRKREGVLPFGWSAPPAPIRSKEANRSSICPGLALLSYGGYTTTWYYRHTYCPCVNDARIGSSGFLIVVFVICVCDLGRGFLIPSSLVSPIYIPGRSRALSQSDSKGLICILFVFSLEAPIVSGHMLI